jgi:phosphate transport system permease protein
MNDHDSLGRLSRRRYWTNRITETVVGVGGGAVIGAITLIFAYLLWVVAPIFAGAEITPGQQFNTVDRPTVLVDISENGEVVSRFGQQGIVEFYDQASGRPTAAFDLGTPIAAMQRVYPEVDLYAVVSQAGQLQFVRSQHVVNFVGDQRQLASSVDFPLGRSGIAIDGADAIDSHLFGGELVVATAATNQIVLRKYRSVELGFDLPRPQQVTLQTSFDINSLFLGPRNQWIYAVSATGDIEIFGISSLTRPTRLYRGELAQPGQQVTAVAPLLGRYSLVVATDEGAITQYGIYTDASGTRLDALRTFTAPAPVQRFITEPRRKGFMALDANGDVHLMYPTSERQLASFAAGLSADAPMAISPRSNVLVSAPSSASIALLDLHNEHPEISFSALWSEVWYEGYEEPIYSWQSSSADNDFEPKFSLTPLAFGTLKAAFYALLFAVPIAIMGAIYTAYFMAPGMRNWVKPGIEIMAALPTVILGFIGGLWLAPIVEDNLSSVLSIFVVLPVGLFVLAIFWSFLPDQWTRMFKGWYGMIVVPLIVLTVYVAFASGPWFEEAFFLGDSRAWFRTVLGLDYDQRNALIVGLIMGLAVIPTIFSISEDAVYAVPTHLVRGSLALGATEWQTLVKVVLLTASPGIFSAVMIGMGRAVGETMIVLMATGNTPLMEWNIFEGMRTFAANIAVELPESELDSTHYRILFLAALVLFAFTFILNTVAEIVRQRLRARYGSL